MDFQPAISGVRGHIRVAVGEDSARMADIDSLTSSYPRGEGGYDACCQGSGSERALVFEQDGRVLGFLVYSPVVDAASIHNIAVCPERQGIEIGRALLSAALEAVRQVGAVTCYLEVRESNTAARGLYQASGFKTDGRRRDYYRTETGREDALLMSLDF